MMIERCTKKISSEAWCIIFDIHITLCIYKKIDNQVNLSCFRPKSVHLEILLTILLTINKISYIYLIQIWTDFTAK